MKTHSTTWNFDFYYPLFTMYKMFSFLKTNYIERKKRVKLKLKIKRTSTKLKACKRWGQTTTFLNMYTNFILNKSTRSKKKHEQKKPKNKRPRKLRERAAKSSKYISLCIFKKKQNKKHLIYICLGSCFSSCSFFIIVSRLFLFWINKINNDEKKNRQRKNKV